METRHRPMVDDLREEITGRDLEGVDNPRVVVVQGSPIVHRPPAP